MKELNGADLTSIAGEIAADRLGMKVCGVVPIVGRGKINTVFRVDSEGDSVVVRVRATAELEGNYAKEAWCLERASMAGIPVPAVRTYGETGLYSFIVEDFIAGVSANEAPIDVLTLWGKLGQYAARLNGIGVSGYGHRMSRETPGRFENTWDEWVSELLTRAFRDDYWIDAGLFTQEQIAILKRSLERCRWIDAQAGIVHIDIGEWNIIVGAGGVDDIYLIDWDLSVAAPVPHYQIATAWCNAPNVRAHDSFVSGYGLSKADLNRINEDVTALIVLELLSGLRWTQDNQPESVPGEAESTQALVRHLYADRLT